MVAWLGRPKGFALQKHYSLLYCGSTGSRLALRPHTALSQCEEPYPHDRHTRTPVRPPDCPPTHPCNRLDSTPTVARPQHHGDQGADRANFTCS